MLGWRVAADYDMARGSGCSQHPELPVPRSGVVSHSIDARRSRTLKPEGDGYRAWPAEGSWAHNGHMRRIIGTIVGAIVAVSLAITSVGSIVATLKTFLIIGLIAMAVIIVVWLVARRPRSAVRRD